MNYRGSPHRTIRSRTTTGQDYYKLAQSVGYNLSPTTESRSTLFFLFLFLYHYTTTLLIRIFVSFINLKTRFFFFSFICRKCRSCVRRGGKRAGGGGGDGKNGWVWGVCIYCCFIVLCGNVWMGQLFVQAIYLIMCIAAFLSFSFFFVCGCAND